MAVSPAWSPWTTKVDADVKVTLRTEFAAIDPSTGTASIYEIEVEYEGKGIYIDPRDFERYLDSFRSERVRREQLCERIWRDVKSALGENVPVRVRLATKCSGVTIILEKGEGTQP
jgi:NADPH-dependent 7-cyano-7-deazaguanine reductase QueF